jgi:hypothetical protein
MNKAELKERVLELIREVDDADAHSADLQAQLEAEQATRLNLAETLHVVKLVSESNGNEAVHLKALLLDVTTACSLLSLQVTFPELHGRILAAKVHEA